MSSTAQKQDITDPDVVAKFAKLVGNEYRLIALYLLTVADVRGTSPKVWNAWKAKLLEDLFRATRRQLSEGSSTKSFDLLGERMQLAREQLALYAIDPANLRQNVAAWATFVYLAADSDWTFRAAPTP